MDGARGDAVAGRGDGAGDRLAGQAEAAVDERRRTGTTRSTPVKRSRSVTPSAPTARSRLRRSMRTPAWARRTLAGARSPERASSLPAMLSCVTSTAAAAELLGEGDGDRAADRVEQHDVAVGRQRGDARAGRRRRRGRRPRRATSYSRAPGRPPVHCTTHAARAGSSVVPVRTVDAEAGDLGRQPLDERAVRSGDGGEPAERRRAARRA